MAGAGRGVILLILDTTRADHLGAYGYPRPTSPELDRLAAEGELFTRAYSVSPWTLPAIASMLTGQMPWVHGADAGVPGSYDAITDGVATVAELAAADGVETAAFVNVSFFNEALGMARGFGHFDRHHYDYREGALLNRGHRDAAATSDAALRWAEARQPGDFFLLVHYFDPHLTYAAPDDLVRLFDPAPDPRIGASFGTVAELFAIRGGQLRLDARQLTTLEARYDAEIRFMDAHIGRLRAGLEKLGMWQQSLVVAVGDHGEEFFEHGGFEHGHSHHAELMHVPLIVRRPRGPGGVHRDHLVQPTGIAAEILRYLEVPVPSSIDDTLSEEPGRIALAAGSLWGGDLVSARSASATVIWRRDLELSHAELYSADDPGERSPLGVHALAEAASLVERLRALPASRRDVPGVWSPRAEELAQLKALGYVQ